MGVRLCPVIAKVVEDLENKRAEVKHPRLLFVDNHTFNPVRIGCLRTTLNVMAKYTHESHITTVEGVKDFFHHIVYDLSINFHPDDDFKNYVCYETGKRTMNDEQAELYNRLMDEAFKACDNEEQVYEIGSNLLLEKLQIERLKRNINKEIKSL